MTKTLASEWGPYKVRVCGIVPGSIAGTEGLARLKDLKNLNNKEKANASFSQSNEDSDKASKALSLGIPL